MSIVRVYSSNPGNPTLVGSGPVINLIEQVSQAKLFAAGRGVLGLVGECITDLGEPEIPVILDNRIDDLGKRFGGFGAWLGTDQAAATVGHPSGYEGNLYARCWGGDAPVVVLQHPDLALKDKSITDVTAANVVLVFTRAVATNGAKTMKAGTRVSDGAGYEVATMEDISWAAAETGDKSVRVRQTSQTTPVAMNTVDTFTDNGLTTWSGDSNVTVDTVSTAVTVPDQIDAAELLLRYTQAVNKLNDNLPGQSVQVLVTDRDEAAMAELVGAHVVASSNQGFFRIGVISPPKGTLTADARTGAADSVDRVALTRTRVAYVHPGVQRRFAEDSANLDSEFRATLPGACLAAMRIALEKPEQNPANPHQLFGAYGVLGAESLAAGTPDHPTHYQSGIMQLDFVVSASGVTPEFFAGILANIPTGSTLPDEIADRRMADEVELGVINALKPWHKKLASLRNRRLAEAAVEAYLASLLSENDPDAQRIAGFDPVVSSWDGTLQMATFPVSVRLLGNMNVITIPINVGTAVELLSTSN